MVTTTTLVLALALGVSGICFMGEAEGAVGEVRAAQKISDTQGNFQGVLDDADFFGHSVAALGDIDGDATPDLSVGAYGDNDGGPNRGAVYVLFLHPNGTVRTEQKISDTQGNFQKGLLDDNDQFGLSVAALGDLDGDATPDLAAGTSHDDDGGPQRGAVYILLLHPNGTVKAEQKISDMEGNFQGVLNDNDYFGYSVATLGDLDGDATQDIAVGAHADDDGGSNNGAVYVLFLHPNGTVRAEQKISEVEGNFQGLLNADDQFGSAVAGLADIDGDATQDLAVGAFWDSDGGLRCGAVYVLLLHNNGTVKAEQKISLTTGNFQGVLSVGANFGGALASIGDVDGDATQDLAVGAAGDDDSGTQRGAVFILLLHPNGMVKAEQKISDSQGNFRPGLSNSDLFGRSLAAGDAAQGLAVGAAGDDDGGMQRGAVYLLFLNVTGREATTGIMAQTTGALAVSSSGSMSTVSSTTANSTTEAASPPLPPSAAGVTASSSTSDLGLTTIILLVVVGVVLCLVAVVVVVRRKQQDATRNSEVELSSRNSVQREDASAYHNISSVPRGGKGDETGQVGEYHNAELAGGSEEAGQYHNFERGAGDSMAETGQYHNLQGSEVH
jgi:FG-GAP repeat